MASSSLQGSSWILTRPAERSAPWANFLQRHGAQVHCDPVLQLSPARGEIDWEPVGSASMWVFSSATTVRHFFSLLPDSLSSSLNTEEKPQFAAVGEATAEAIKAAGQSVTCQGPGTGADDLVRVILSGPKVDSAVHVTSDAGLPVIQQGLIDGGIPCERVEVSQSTRVPNLDISRWKVLRESWSGVIYSSPATVEGVLAQSGSLAEWVRGIPGVAVGARTAEAMQTAGILQRHVATSADLEGLYEACVSAISAGNMGPNLKD